MPLPQRKMDPRLRGDDEYDVRHAQVIPAQAGIHASTRLDEGLRPRTWLSRKM